MRSHGASARGGSNGWTRHRCGSSRGATFESRPAPSCGSSCGLRNVGVRSNDDVRRTTTGPLLNGPLERRLRERGTRAGLMRVLVIDIGASHTKLAIAESDERAEIDSSQEMSPQFLFPRIRTATEHW